MSPSAAETITRADGAPQSINTIYQDPRGSLFVTALNGRLFQVASQALVPVLLPASLRALPIRNVFRDSSGTLWMGTDGQGVVRFSERGTERYTMRQGLVNDFVRAFCEDREGDLWIGTDGGLSRFSAGRFQNFNIESGLVYGSIRLLLADRTGNLWIGTDGGLSQFRAGGFVTDPLLERLRGQKIWALHEDSAGGLWIGTHGAGLFWLKAGKLAQFTIEQGLPSNKIHFIAEDAHAQLWMSGLRLDNPPDSSRWYPGGGIYRNVWLVKTAPVHVGHWGTYVATSEVARDKARVEIKVRGQSNIYRCQPDRQDASLRTRR